MPEADAPLRRRLALNEARARQLNQSRSEYWLVDREPAAFWCECSDPGCSALIQLTLGQWRELRADPVQFMVLPGHATEDLEGTAKHRDGYWIVAKLGEPQETIAKRTDTSA